MENEAKKQKERETMKWRAKISAPTLFNSAKAQSTQSTQKKKKIQTSNFMIKISSHKFQNSKAQKFQISNKKFLSSKVLEFEIRISKFPSFKDQMFLKRKIFC